MSLEEQTQRRDAMINAVESAGGGFQLAAVVRELYESGKVPIDVLFADLEQIEPLLDQEGSDHVTDVMDMVVGFCRPEFRIGPYSWTDPRNIFYERHKAGKPLAGPD